jgi:hypothetical protein
MAPEDVELVRPTLQADVPEPEPDEDGDGRAEHVAWLEDELVRLKQEVAASGVRQRAFERYLDALEG